LSDVTKFERRRSVSHQLILNNLWLYILTVWLKELPRSGDKQNKLKTMCLMCYFVLTIRIAFFIPCFIFLYSVMYYQDMFFFPCNMFSVCSVHPLIWEVLSTRRTKCTITNCLKSPDMWTWRYKAYDTSDEGTQSEWTSQNKT
jgi:hypothetical protein